MKIFHIKDENDIHQEEETVLVLGYFDGLHRGHKELFGQARLIADKKGLKVAVLTFPESPKLTFARFEPELLLHIVSPQKRLEKFEEYGVDYLYFVDFTSQFANVSSDDFIHKYIESLRANTVVAGFDYHFGHNRTSCAYLQRNFSGRVVIVSEQTSGDEKISSTRIRQLIKNGQVAEANHLLGYHFSTRGIVVHGDARGRTIGYPTANFSPIDRTHLPKDGVYITDVILSGKKYRAMTSVGKNVTFDGTELRLEAHIFDFEGDLYGHTIEVVWLDKIRDMIKFKGIDELVTQLKEDEQLARNYEKV